MYRTNFVRLLPPIHLILRMLYYKYRNEQRNYTMHHSLISTALLAQQQANKVTFTMSGGPEDNKSGFWFT